MWVGGWLLVRSGCLFGGILKVGVFFFCKVFVFGI